MAALLVLPTRSAAAGHALSGRKRAPTSGANAIVEAEDGLAGCVVTVRLAHVIKVEGLDGC